MSLRHDVSKMRTLAPKGCYIFSALACEGSSVNITILVAFLSILWLAVQFTLTVFSCLNALRLRTICHQYSSRKGKRHSPLLTHHSTETVHVGPAEIANKEMGAMEEKSKKNKKQENDLTNRSPLQSQSLSRAKTWVAC